MQLTNPFDRNLVEVNDPDDFVMPYKIYGNTDYENMLDRYMKLKKVSSGYKIRLGEGIKYK